MARNWAKEIIAGLYSYDVQTTDAALDPDVTLTLLVPGAAFTPANCILGAGNSGQVHIIVCAGLAFGIEIKITNYEGLANQEFSFANVGDYMALRWQGVYWELLEKTAGVTNTT